MAEKKKGWEERLAELGEGLDAWYERFEAEFKKLRRQREGLFRRLSTEELDLVEHAARENVGDDFLLEVSGFYDELCEIYLNALPGERARIRARVGSHETTFQFFWSYVQSMPDLVLRPEDETRLRLGLAAVSIHDLRNDIEAVDEILGRLWLAAEEARIDPAPHFAAVAEVSNRATGGGSAHFRDRLASFAESLYFKEHVLPRSSHGKRRAS